MYVVCQKYFLPLLIVLPFRRQFRRSTFFSDDADKVHCNFWALLFFLFLRQLTTNKTPIVFRMSLWWHIEDIGLKRASAALWDEKGCSPSFRPFHTLWEKSIWIQPSIQYEYGKGTSKDERHEWKTEQETTWMYLDVPWHSLMIMSGLLVEFKRMNHSWVAISLNESRGKNIDSSASEKNQGETRLQNFERGREKRESGRDRED